MIHKALYQEKQPRCRRPSVARVFYRPGSERARSVCQLESGAQISGTGLGPVQLQVGSKFGRGRIRNAL